MEAGSRWCAPKMALTSLLGCRDNLSQSAEDSSRDCASRNSFEPRIFSMYLLASSMHTCQSPSDDTVSSIYHRVSRPSPASLCGLSGVELRDWLPACHNSPTLGMLPRKAQHNAGTWSRAAECDRPSPVWSRPRLRQPPESVPSRPSPAAGSPHLAAFPLAMTDHYLEATTVLTDQAFPTSSYGSELSPTWETERDAFLRLLPLKLAESCR